SARHEAELDHRRGIARRNEGPGSDSPELQDSQWMNFLATLHWQAPYGVTDCAWVYRCPGIGVNDVELTYISDPPTSRYDMTMPKSALAAVNGWHHPNPRKEQEIRKEPWGLQVRLECAEFSHSKGRHLFTLTPMKYLYYVAIQQRLRSNPELHD